MTSNPQANTSVTMRSIIQRIATGPDLSKDLPEDEARAGMQMILSNEVPSVQAGIFLIALRMKRETDDENCGVLQALIDHADIATAEVDDVVDLAAPYDGYTRSLLNSPFLPMLLAEMGAPCVSHGAESMGPKYGVTHRQVLRAAGLATELTAAQATERIANSDIGWAHVDQSRFCKPLSDLHDLRDDMVKRSVLTTVEVLVGPVRGRKATHRVTGYVHKPTPASTRCSPATPASTPRYWCAASRAVSSRHCASPPSYSAIKIWARNPRSIFTPVIWTPNRPTARSSSRMTCHQPRLPVRMRLPAASTPRQSRQQQSRQDALPSAVSTVPPTTAWYTVRSTSSITSAAIRTVPPQPMPSARCSTQALHCNGWRHPDE